jgi:hypothetical protein
VIYQYKCQNPECDQYDNLVEVEQTVMEELAKTIKEFIAR